MATNKPKTLQEAIVYFSDPERAFQYGVQLRWPDGKVLCPRCGHAEHSFIKTRRLWFCKGCKQQFTIKVGTIFEDSPISLDKWMTAVWMLVNCKNGISSYEIAKAIGITQKSAWFMLHRIRRAMQQGSAKVKLGGSGGGEVEADETFIGGKARNMHHSVRLRRIQGQGFNVEDKTTVMGILERGGKIRAHVIPDRRKETLQPLVRKNVERGAALYTDELVGYQGLDREYEHKVVDHAARYVDGRVHTNGMENFWSLLKRGLGGTYVSVEPFHLFRYLDEQVFRYNNRKNRNKKPLPDSSRFALAMSNVLGKRLTYAELTGKNESPRHTPTGAGQAQA